MADPIADWAEFAAAHPARYFPAQAPYPAIDGDGLAVHFAGHLPRPSKLYQSTLWEKVSAHEPNPCPECRAGKCRNCDATSWDNELDTAISCPCADAGHESKGETS